MLPEVGVEGGKEMRGERNGQMEIPTQVPNLKTKPKAPISCGGRRGNTKNIYHCVRTEPNQGNLYLVYYRGLKVLLL
jgi:hypothetical protein